MTMKSHRNLKSPAHAAFAALALLFALACGSGAEAPNNEAKTDDAAKDAPSAAADGRPALYLDGLFATSSAPGADVAALFDADPSTGWRTQSGAGTDEGVMLYFSEKQQVSVASVEILPAENTLAEGARIQIYTNAQLDNSGKPGEKIALEPRRSNEPLRSLFIRFAATGKEKTSAPRTDGNEKIAVQTFPSEGFVALRQVNLLNSAGQPLRVVPPRRVRGTVSATSTLAPESAFAAANLFDGRRECVWAEGAANAGEGEGLSFEFAQLVNITAIQIWNGYQRSDNHYSANARLRNFEFGAAGSPAQSYTLADRKAGQRIELAAAARGQKFDLKIRDVFKGGKYKDLAISDLVFFDGAQPFVLASDAPLRFENELRQKATGTPLAEALGRRIFNDTEFASLTQQRSLILRPDGTFVMYDQTDDEGISSETAAEGNWELLEANASAAKIKVSGKWHDFTVLPETADERETNKIFSETMTLDREKIVGGKMLGTFWLR